MTEEEFEPTISACERPHSYVLGRAATGTGSSSLNLELKVASNFSFLLQYISKKMQRYTVYFIRKLLYIFRVIPPPIIRSANNYIYSIWYLAHRYCYLPLSWRSSHHQKRKQLYLQHLVFVTPLLLSAAIVEELELFHDSGR
jgi:hypothetical protein